MKSHPYSSSTTSRSYGLAAALVALLVLATGCTTETAVAVRQPTPVEAWAGADATVRPPVRPLPVISRAAWAEAPPIVSRLRPMGGPWRITVHHEGSDAHELTGIQAVAQRLRTIARVHERPLSRGGLGAGDLAYHFVVDRAGRIWEGRSLTWQGAHAGNGAANVGNIGIEVMGNSDVQRPSREQLTSLRRLLLDLCRRYDISPQHVYGHDEVKAQYGLPPTRCPGRHLSAWLKTFQGRALGARAER